MSRAEDVLKYFELYKDYTDARVNSGIEAYRKGFANIKIRLTSGEDVTGFTVKAVQKKHEFKHGANIFLVGEFHDEEKDKTYKEKFSYAFNLATLPFYWNTLEPEEGKHRFSEDSPEIYRRPPIERCMRFCEEYGIEPKMHCLNYDFFTPEWAMDLPVPELKKKLDKRFRELSELYADRIPMWEVTNETFKSMDVYPSSKFYLEDDFVEWSFDTAEKYFPNNHLIINDYYIWDRELFNNRSAYYMQIERLLRHGVHLDTIGFQFHSFFPQDQEADMAKYHYNPLVLYKILDNYAKLGKRLQLTEMTIPSYSNDEEDERIQAEIVKNIYRIMFSHPAMDGIIYWNLVDGYAFSKTSQDRDSIGDMSSGENVYHGGLLRMDLSEKPAYKVIKDLFNKEWHTETNVNSDCDTAILHGFFGEYELTFNVNGKEFVRKINLSRDSKNNFEFTF